MEAECFICRNEWNATAHAPHVIPCGHTLCRECLQRPEMRECPFCKAAIRGCADLPCNHALMTLLASKDAGAPRGVCPKASLQLTQIFVRTMTDLTINAHVDLYSTVADLKALIRDITGVPSSQQRLIYCGKQLEDERDLRSYAMKANDTVHMIVRLRGGC
ncbi:hypothetical protein GPECTOR_18g115 [Gonium pectorale]|uniref:Ubiquitin-like domain-containing protein n=1 Tax=Gonium pectorale TaxID=33097 RepID=A0A150GJH3_GONPE|nr:hypothetical protein GPECTOR_18g115 [Gonium pectorale]|eukprot:KXZ49957.1 hypothetical protein GPECTOR_18g115 [Gonium pectorale]